jgi:phage FluMu gp28-like protein
MTEALAISDVSVDRAYGADEVDVLPPVFMPYQQRLWTAIETHNLVVVEKSRRTGFSWAVAAVAEMYAALKREDRGQDVYYMGYDKDMTREFVGYVGDWAKQLQAAASEMEEEILPDPDKPEKFITVYRIKFASGFEVSSLPSVPRALRGKQGLVIIDEAAFIDDLEEVIKAALALLMWGGRVVIISTHNGETNAFNTLITDIRGKRRAGYVMRLTFDEAMDEGLYRRIALTTHVDWTQEREDAFRADILQKYADNADEELNVIPNPSTGAYLPGILIERRSVKDIPVLRYNAPLGMATWSQRAREETIEHWIEENIKPILDRIDSTEPHAIGQDFGRSRDLTVIWLLAISTSLGRNTRMVIELRNTPFEQQKQILWYVLSHVWFRKAILDAGGNGAHLAEITAQKFGSRVEELKFTEDWYRREMPPMKTALEDAMLDIPMDRDIHTDLRSLKLIRGIARIADHTRVDPKAPRHGDAAIALALAYCASCADPEEYGYEGIGSRNTESRNGWRDHADQFDEDDEPATTSGMMPDLR